MLTIRDQSGSTTKGRDVNGLRGAWNVLYLSTWAAPLTIFAFSRMVSALLVIHLGREQRSSYAPDGLQLPLASDPATYLNLLTNWDGQWYLQIAEHGYPSRLPVVDGAVVENAWAFYPFFPGLVRLLTHLGISPALAATLVASTCAGLAMVILYRMLAPSAGRFTAAMTVTAFSFGPTSLILQSAYSESLALVEILLVLWALQQRRYVASGVFAAALAFTRPVALPLAAVIGIVWLVRFRGRQDRTFSRREMVAHASLAIGTAASFAIWPAICAIVTGQSDAYALTQRAWLDEQPGWNTWLSPLVTGSDRTVLVLALPAAVLMTWIACRRAARVWGVELQAWAALYPLFILAVSRPTTSIFRYLALTTVSAWPAPDLSEKVRTKCVRVTLWLFAILIGCIAQWFWIRWFWVITDPAITGIP